MSTNPANVFTIERASRVVGHRLEFRPAAATDAEYILSLRTDPEKARFLSETSPELDLQRAWLKSTDQDSSQAYYIIIDRAGTPVGTIRMYDVQGPSFSWGSWIKGADAPSGFALESALLVYHVGLWAGFERAHFEVRIDNDRVCAFHERMGAVCIRETTTDRFYEIDHDSILAALSDNAAVFPDGISVRRT